MLKKAKLYSLLVIIITSVAVSVFGPQEVIRAQTPNTPTTPGTTANPDTTDDINGFRSSTVANETTANVYTAVFSYCMSQESKAIPSNGMNFTAWQQKQGGDIPNYSSGAAMQQGNWFNPKAGEKSAVGYAVDGTDGVLSCSEINYQNIKGTLDKSTSPYDSSVALACYLGFVAATINNINSSGETTNNSTFTLSTDQASCVSAVTNPTARYYAGTNGNGVATKLAQFRTLNINGSPAITPEQDYILYKDALDKCGTPVDFKDTIDSTAPDSKTPYTVTIVVNSQGKTRDVYYNITDPNAKKPVGPGSDLGGPGGLTCTAIIAGVNNTVGAYSQWLIHNQDKAGTNTTPAAGTGGGGDAKSNCQVTGIGWIVCPVINFIARVADSAYSVLDTYFLKLAPVNVDTNDTSNGLYRAWSAMRDIANVVFVIVFLMLVFSQLTGMGISNYGIKRMIPKLILAAILVNSSYFICAFFVDVSNIVGSSLKGFLDTLSAKVLPVATTTANGSYWSDEAHTLLSDVVIGGALIGTAAIASMAGFAVFIPLVFIVLPILIAVLVAVLVRQALAVLLIFISPLAFVAMLLPNTEDLYKKWKEAFKVVLLFYPIVALVFGASALASTILMAAAPAAGDKGAQIIQGIAAGAIRIVPLIAIPAIMKLVTGVLGKFGGIVNDPGKGWFDNRRNIATENGKIRAADRIGKIGNWVNPTKLDADGKPIPDTDPRHKRLFGGSGSLRRRAVGALTAYGVSDRERYRKDRLDAAEKTLEGTYLGSERGQDARNAAKNAQINLQNAQINTDTIRISSAEGMALQQEATNAEKRQKLAQDEAMTAAVTALPAALLGQAETAETRRQTADVSAKAIGTTMMTTTAQGQGALKAAEAAAVSNKTAEDNAKSVGLSYLSGTATGQAMVGAAKTAELAREELENDIKTAGTQRADENQKIRTETSSERLNLAIGRDKQTYEELAATGSTHPKLSTLGVGGAEADAAHAARFEKKAVESATSNATYEGTLAYAQQIKDEAEARARAIKSGANPDSVSPLLNQAGGNINPDAGRTRAEDRAVSVRSGASNEEVANAKAKIEAGDPTGTITRAKDALVAANRAGDSVGARAAAQVLASKGAKGGAELSDTIKMIEAIPSGTAGAANPEVFSNIRAELTGRKDIDSAMDRWATEGGSLESRQKDQQTIHRLNEEELAKQQMHVLQAAKAAGTLTKEADLIRRVLAQSGPGGTIKLDTDKRQLLMSALPPTPPPPPPPPDPSMRAGTI